MKTVVIISTYNRRDLTGITLDAVMACKDATTEVYVLDDASTEYDRGWLSTFSTDHSWGRTHVVVNDERIGVGPMARARIERFIETGADLGIMLDNDALVVRGFDAAAMEMYGKLRSPYDEPVILTLYRSTYHEATDLSTQWICGLHLDEMKDIGGISLVMDRSTARHLLDNIDTWDSQWDFQLQKHARVFAPHVSYVEHIGRHGSGVNGQSGDRAVNFVGYQR